ncbi:hypothetical protein BC827DRAFT_1151811 [Russula dissimulans]|nr:hypothetical protein BC827DRAFT_1151811 [Russula dissimulans]
MFPPIETPDDFFAPHLQVDAPPADSFDQEEFGEVEIDWPSQQLEIEYILSTLYKDPVTSTPSTTTYSTDYSQDSASQYSDYSIPSDVAPNGPGVHIMYNSYSPDMFYDSSSSSAHSDYGTSDPSDYRPSFEPSLPDLSRTMQDLAITFPPGPPLVPVEATADAHANVARTKPFKCPYCSFSSARKYNLKTHIGTHNKEKSKKFECGICMRGFSRKHDLQRHQATRHGHGDQKSLLSARMKSARASEPAIGAFEEIIAWIPGV